MILGSSYIPIIPTITGWGVLLRCSYQVRILKGGVFWVAVKELNLSDLLGEALLFTIYIYIYTPIMVT